MAKQDAIDLLKEDHRTVEGLFEKFEKTKNKKDKEDIARQICAELVIHSTIEEEIFYPAVTGKIEEDTVREAYVEHDGAKVLIAELAGGDIVEDEFFEAKVTVLSEMIKHHVKEEEQKDGMFDQAEDAKVDLKALGAELLARKEALTADIKKNGLPEIETRSFHGHELAEGEPIEKAA